MKDLGNMNERLLQMLMIDIDFSVMDIEDRVTYNLKVYPVLDNGIIGQWFYIKEE